MDAAIGPATSEEIAFFYGRVGEYTVMRINGEAIAMGVIRQMAGRTWVMFDVTEAGQPHIIRIIRALKARLRELNETVYTVCAAPEFPKAGRLLALCGFAPTDEMAITGKRIWRWNKRAPR